MPNLEAIDVYNALKERLGEEQTRALLKYIEDTARANVATKEDLWLTRDELKDETVLLRQDLMKVREELKADIAALRQDLMKVRDESKGENAALRDELKGDVAALRQDLVKFKDESKADIAALDKRVGQLDLKVGELDLKIEKVRVELLEEITKTKWYFMITVVIIVLTNPKILELLGKAITLFR
jgi:uncharacterized protein involved in exopolysaccharide biosynthesis